MDGISGAPRRSAASRVASAVPALPPTILPASVYGKEIPFASGMNQGVAKQALQKADALKQYNLLAKRDGGIVIPQAHQILQDKRTDKKRLFLLVCVFIFLIIILIIVFIMSMGGA